MPAQLIVNHILFKKLHAERFCSLEKASNKGVFTLKHKYSDFTTSKELEKQSGIFSYHMDMNGYGGLAAKQPIKEDSEKSFSVRIEMEVYFQITGSNKKTSEEFSNLMKDAFSQVYSVGVSKMISLVAELGFVGVRPPITLEYSAIPNI